MVILRCTIKDMALHTARSRLMVSMAAIIKMRIMILYLKEAGCIPVWSTIHLDMCHLRWQRQLQAFTMQHMSLWCHYVPLFMSLWCHYVPLFMSLLVISLSLWLSLWYHYVPLFMSLWCHYVPLLMSLWCHHVPLFMSLWCHHVPLFMSLSCHHVPLFMSLSCHCFYYFALRKYAKICKTVCWHIEAFNSCLNIKYIFSHSAITFIVFIWKALQSSSKANRKLTLQVRLVK